jgi:hypothetical protein
MKLIDFPDLQVTSSFCPGVSGNYWSFQVYRGNNNPRVYRLPEFPSDWPVKTRWNHVEDREPLLSVARQREIVF